MNFTLNDGGRSAAGYKGNTGDCVCRAICIVTGKPYQEVYDRLAEGNASGRTTVNLKRKAKRLLAKAGYHTITTKMINNTVKTKFKTKSAAKGIYTKSKWFKDYMTSLGFEWVPTMTIGKSDRVHLKADELPRGKIICKVSRHLVAVIDGVVNDTYDCSRDETRLVYGYYKLVRQ